MKICHQFLKVDAYVSSSLLLFLAAGVHGHDEGLVGAVTVASRLLPNVLDVVQVFEDLIGGENLDVKRVVDVKLE